LAVASFTGFGIQKKIGLVDQYCKNWNLKCDCNKFKIMVFEKGGKLMATERWTVSG
jgi:hypothetical protein